MKKNGTFVIALKIIPKAHKNEIVSWENNVLKIRLSAVPEKGEANAELIRFLAKRLEISPSGIELVHGAQSRHKRISISGITQEEMLKKLFLI